MKHKWWIVFAAILVLLLLIGGFFAYFDWAFKTSFQKSEIKEGFSPQLLNELQTRYGITVPEDAQFIKGYNLPGWQDSFVTILFECPMAPLSENTPQHVADSVQQMLKLDTTRYSGYAHDSRQFPGADWYDELGGVMEYAMDDNNYTTISYSVQEDSIRIRVVGWRPGAEFP